MSYSAISDYETAMLVITFFAYHESTFNCGDCLKRNKDKKKRDEKKGCNYSLSAPVAKYHDIYQFKRCPGALKNSSYLELINLHGHWELGVLPFEGGLLDQPAKLVQAMRIISSLKLEHQKDVQEKARKWQKTKSASNSTSKYKTR